MVALAKDPYVAFTMIEKIHAQVWRIVYHRLWIFCKTSHLNSYNV